MKWKKRASSGAPRTPFSSALRQAAKLIGERDYPAALSQLSELASHAQAEKSQIAALVAKTQFLLGRYEESAEQYRAASDMADESNWFTPALGEIRSLLKAQALDRAQQRAAEIEKLAIEKSAQFEALANTTAPQLQNMGSLRVGAQPVRPTVALTRLGITFWQEGYLEEAKTFFETVIAQTPNGASRARQFLANICLREQQFDRAEQLARESLQMGRFQAKTVASWPILLKARFAQKKELLDAPLYQSLKTTQSGSLYARAVLLIVKELRSYGDGDWEKIAQDWLETRSQEDPIIRMEILKIFLSDQKVASRSPEWILQTCSELIEDPLLTANESIGVAKTLTEYGLLAGAARTQDLSRQIYQRFGEATAAQAVHAMALGAIRAKQYDTARTLLGEQRQVPGSEQWGKDRWALASMESALHNYAEAAEHYLAIAEQTNVPSQFRLQGFLRWFRAAEKSGEEIDFAEVEGKLREMVSGISDYRTLLDAGRQLALAGSRFKEVCTMVTGEGERKALAAFHEEKDPTTALGILNHLARRQYYDLSRTAHMLEQWESLGQEKLGWLWSSDARYWEYLSLIMRGYLDRGQPAKGEKLAKETLSDPTVPDTGYIYMAAPYADWLMGKNRSPEAWPLFEQMLRRGPAHRLTAEVHYWIGLKNYRESRETEAIQSLQRARQCLAPKPALRSEWIVDAKAALLLRKLTDETVDTRLYSKEFLEKQTKALEWDLEDLG